MKSSLINALTPNIAFLVTGGRNGSLLFQSLLDGHPEIAQFPGTFDLSGFVDGIKNLGDATSCVKMFIDRYKHCFDSSLDTALGMNRLGEDRTSSMQLSTREFSCRVIKYMTELGSNPSVENIIVAFHRSYYELCNGVSNSERIKLILVHVHTVDAIGVWRGSKPDIIFMERDPLPSLQSEIETFMRYYREELNMLLPWSALHRKLLEPVRVVQTGFPAYTIRLEELHRQPKQVLLKFCEKYNLKVSNCLFESTFFGLKWWGDDRQLEPKNGLNPDFTNRLREKGFFKWELACYEELLAERLRVYGYPFRAAGKTRWSILTLLILPGRYEWRCLSIVLQNCFSRNSKVRRKGFIGLAIYVRSFGLKYAVWKLRKDLGHVPCLLEPRI